MGIFQSTKKAQEEEKIVAGSMLTKAEIEEANERIIDHHPLDKLKVKQLCIH